MMRLVMKCARQGMIRTSQFHPQKLVKMARESRYPKVGSEEHEHEEFELPTFSLLEEILIEGDSTKYTFSPPLDDDKLYPGASISTMYAVSLLVWCA